MSDFKFALLVAAVEIAAIGLGCTIGCLFGYWILS